MNAQRLLEHFDRLIDTPDAVPRLRRFVLDLAVRGKLVEQDSKDEPAGELLKRIVKEKARQIKEGSLRQQEARTLAKEDAPFDLPAGWRWTQLAEIGVINPRCQADDSVAASFVPMPMISAKYGQPHEHEVRQWGEIKKGFTQFAEGDVGLAKITPCFENGKSTVFRGLTGGLGAGTTELHVLRPVFVSADYILVFLKSSHFIGTGIPRMTGTAGQKRVPREYFAFSPVPLPPLAEQHRIVVKVDELMALCDELEAAQNKREKRRGRLVAATLHGLNNGDATPTPGAPTTFEESARFYFNHLPRLTTRPEHIHQLRQTILNLAVRGKLVPQDPEDEPAVELLSRIEILRTKLLTEGYPNESEASNQLRKQRSQVLPVGLPPLPPGWCWATLMQCSALIVDCHNKTAPYSSNGVILLRTTNVRDGKLNLSQPKFVDEQTYTRWSARYRPEAGDILITREAPMGEVCIIPSGMKVCLGQRMMLVKLIPGTIDQKFMLYSLRDPQLMDRVQDKPVGATVQHLRVGGVETLLVALPPLAEQHRIVAKVDELMALCDELEAGLASASTTSEQLLEVSLAGALARN